MKKGDLVKIYWVDATTHPGWRNLEDDDLCVLDCITVGMLYCKNDISITVALNWADNNTETGQFGDYMEIPMVSVIKIKKLKE